MSNTHTGNIQPTLDMEEHITINSIPGKKVYVIDSQGNVVDFGSDSNQAILVADSSIANVEFIGRGAIAAASNASVWQIQRIDNTSGFISTWADGNENYDNLWTNVENLSYT